MTFARILKLQFIGVAYKNKLLYETLDLVMIMMNIKYEISKEFILTFQVMKQIVFKKITINYPLHCTVVGTRGVPRHFFFLGGGSIYLLNSY